jgi:hypothetical protein
MVAAAAERPTGSSRARQSLRQRMDLVAPSSIPSRGARFLKRLAPPYSGARTATLADLTTLPDWIMLDEALIADVASVVALLHFRRQIDRIVDGDQIRQMCEILGEHNFDMACEAPLPSEDMLARIDAPLPPPDQLHDFGKRLLIRALPTIMSDRFAGAVGDRRLGTLANHAVAMIKLARQDECL